MEKRATSIGNQLMSVVYALIWCVVIWGILPSGTSAYVLLIPFFWFIHARNTSERLDDLRELIEINNELLLEAVARRDPTFDVEEYLENRGYRDYD